MATERNTYTLVDILGEPLTRQEALSFIHQNTDEDDFQLFQQFDDLYRDKLLKFIMGKNGLAITYDKVFRQVMMPGDTSGRLEHFLSSLLEEQVEIEQILPREGNLLFEEGSFVIADIIVRLENGSTINVEIQKIGYNFPGERGSCYTADMIMRQYNYQKNNNINFSYNLMKPVYLIVFMEKSPALFHTTNQYIHKKVSYFDSGIPLKLLDNITYISLDTFRELGQNIKTEQDAWLKFLTEDDPDEIVIFVNQYPEFLPLYQDLIKFRQNPKEMIYMFSEALRQMDKNMERYMVEEMQKELEDLKISIQENRSLLKEKESMLQEKDSMLQEKDSMLQEKDKLIQELKQKIAQQNF